MPPIDPIEINKINKEKIETNIKKKTYKLEKGDIVKGTIVSKLTEDKTILIIGNEKYEVKNSIKLMENKSAYFRIAQVKPEIVLKVIEIENIKISTLKQFAATIRNEKEIFGKTFEIIDTGIKELQKQGKFEVPESINQLWKILKEISLKKENIENNNSLKIFLKNSGMVWESKIKNLVIKDENSKKEFDNIILNDLKGITLKAINENTGDTIISKNDLKSFVEVIQKLQIFNSVSSEEQGKIFLLVPIILNEKILTIQILFDLRYENGGGKNKKNESIRVSIFLEMPTLGPVRVEASILKKKILIGFIVENNIVKKLFDEYSHLLKKKLEEKEFDAQEIICRIEERKVLKDTDLIDVYFERNENQISIVI